MLIPLHLNSPLSDLFFFNLRHPVQQPVDWRLTIAEKGQQILGDNLLGLQAFFIKRSSNLFPLLFLFKPVQKRTYSCNQSSSHQWTAGAVYYSGIRLSRNGTTNTSQIIDGNNDLTSAYAILEQGALSEVATIDFIRQV